MNESLKDSKVFLYNKYWITDDMRRICELPDEITMFKIINTWQMVFMSDGQEITMLTIEYNNGKRDHHRLDFIEGIIEHG